VLVLAVALSNALRRAAIPVLRVRVTKRTSLRRPVEEASLGRVRACGQHSAGRPHVAVVLDGIALTMLTSAHSAAIRLPHIRQSIPIEVVLVHAVVHAAGSPIGVMVFRLF